jgi:hypothetical protein
MDPLNTIYDEVDTFLLGGDFAAVDTMLRRSIVDTQDDELLAMLTATLPAKSKLPSRSEYYAAVRARPLRTRGRSETADMLRGLA